MSDECDTRDLVRAHVRLEMAPADLTAHDVDLLGTVRVGLGVRAAVAYELARALTGTKAPASKPSRRRAKR